MSVVYGPAYGPPIAGTTRASTGRKFKVTPEPVDTEFKRDFPPDAQIGSELDETARVWKVYRKEAEAFDRALLQGWSETLDILLIFAGLFSAVATTFVIESYHLLQPDNSAYTAVALYILVSASNHSTGITLPPPPDLSYATSDSRWINALWFTSILLSLAVALISILVKQWITQYRTRNNATATSPQDWVRRREVYFQALNAWPVAEIVAFLPFLLHLSLFLFFGGVVAFLWTVDRAIGIWTVTLGGFLGLVYAGCSLRPLWAPDSPTYTPLVRQMRTVPLAVILAGIQSSLFVFRMFARLRSAIVRCVMARTSCLPLARAPPTANSLSPSSLLMAAWTRIATVYDDVDKFEAQHHLAQDLDSLDASALHRLITRVSDPDAVAVALQALGARGWEDPLAMKLRSHAQLSNFREKVAFTRSSSEHPPSEILRVARSALCMCPEGEKTLLFSRVHSLYTLGDPDYPDLALLRRSAKDIASDAAVWYETDDPPSESLTSTALLALRVQGREDPLVILFCCDLGSFSDAEWDLALSAAENTLGIELEYVADFGKPLYLAAIIAGNHIGWDDKCINELLRRILRCARTHDTAVASKTYNLFSSSILNLLTSKRFLELEIDFGPLTRLEDYFGRYSDIAMEGEASSVIQFWYAYACVINATFTAASRDSSVYTFPAATSEVALHACPRTDDIRGQVLDICLERPSTGSATSQSLWTISTSGESDQWLRFAAALASYLGGARNKDAARIATWSHRFFAGLSYEILSRNARPNSPYDDDYGQHIHSRGLVHLFQHCNELNPQWWSNVITGSSQSSMDTNSAYLAGIQAEASQNGACQYCH